MARSPRTPRAAIRAIEARPAFVRGGAERQSARPVDVTSLPDGADTIQFAQHVRHADRAAACSSAGSPRACSTGSSADTSRRSPSDRRQRLRARRARARRRRPARRAAGLPAAERGLAEAVGRASQGSFGRRPLLRRQPGEELALARRAHRARGASCSRPVKGEGKWVPWLLLGGVRPRRHGRAAARRPRRARRRAAARQPGALRAGRRGRQRRDLGPRLRDRRRLLLAALEGACSAIAADEIGDDPQEWAARVHPDDVASAAGRPSTRTCAASVASFESEHRMRHSDGDVPLVSHPRRGDPRPPRRADADRRLDVGHHRPARPPRSCCATSALHDALTGLPNRALFLDRAVALPGAHGARARPPLRGHVPRPRPLQAHQRQLQPRRRRRAARRARAAPDRHPAPDDTVARGGRRVHRPPRRRRVHDPARGPRLARARGATIAERIQARAAASPSGSRTASCSSARASGSRSARRTRRRSS